jgi:phosphoglycerate-specific signal transduction histidine kinase
MAVIDGVSDRERRTGSKEGRATAQQAARRTGVHQEWCCVAQRAADRQARLLNETDEFELLGGGVSLERSSPAAIMLF